MADYFEIDFLAVETKKSGDAIGVRYSIDNDVVIHVVDGGFQDTGQSMVDHINKYYKTPTFIDHVVLTHPDADHACGLIKVLESFAVGTLWMNRPWIYAEDIIDRFATYNSVDALRNRLRAVYPYAAQLEDAAEKNGVNILPAFQGQRIGEFTVLSPSKERYFDLIVSSEKTPEAVEQKSPDLLKSMLAEAKVFFKSLWGQEVFSPNETSAENEMSIIQFANLCGQKILLTGDAGRTGLRDAADYYKSLGNVLPGVDRIQIPHHGSRRNVSSEVLDLWLGEKLATASDGSSGNFTAIVSSAKADEHHPRNAVVRAFIHRGAKVIMTEGMNIRTSGGSAPVREGWGPVTPAPYPNEQEE